MFSILTLWGCDTDWKKKSNLPYAGQQWVKLEKPVLPGILQWSLWWNLAEDTLPPLLQSDRQVNRKWINLNYYITEMRKQ